MKFQKFVRSRLKRDLDSGECDFTRGFYTVLRQSILMALENFKENLAVIICLRERENPKVPSKSLAGRCHVLVQGNLEGGAPYNGMYCSEV